MGSVGVPWRGLRVSVLALVIHKAKRLRRFMLSSLARPILPYFWTLSHKGYDFRGGGGNFLK